MMGSTPLEVEVVLLLRVFSAFESRANMFSGERLNKMEDIAVFGGSPLHRDGAELFHSHRATASTF